MKIIFVGDPHLDSQNPISRLDDFKETTLNKLESLLELCISRNVESVIFAGDMFHRYDVSTSYLVNVISKLSKFKSNNIELYSLIGNHDLPHDKMEYFNRTPLSLLFATGIVKHIGNVNRPLKIFGGGDRIISIYGLDYTNKVSQIKVDAHSDLNILAMHYATDGTIAGEGSIPREELKDFDIVMSGHDHAPYKISGEKPIMLRPGSFTRRTKDAYNLTRDIILYELDLQKPLKEMITEVKLPNVLPSEKVFKNEIFSGASIFDSSLIDFSEAFSKLYEEAKVSSIYDIIEWLISHARITNQAGEAIKKYLKEQGI